MATEPIGTDPSEAGRSDSGIDSGAIFASFVHGDSGGGDSGSNSGGIRDALGNEFDGSIHVSPDSRNRDGSFRRRRGRKSGNSAGNRGGKAQSFNSASLDAFTNMLAIVHVGIAGLTSTPELILEDNEARNLAEASANVLTQFDITPDPKTQAIIGLVLSASMIYGPRVYLIIERKKEEKKIKEANAS